MLTKTVRIDGKKVTFRCSAAIPRLYRIKFNRDIFKDLAKLGEGYDNDSTDPNDTNFSYEQMEILEHVAYIMALHADPTIPNDMEEWLSQFQLISFFEILQVIFDLWGSNNKTTVSQPKNLPAPQEN